MSGTSAGAFSHSCSMIINSTGSKHIPENHAEQQTPLQLHWPAGCIIWKCANLLHELIRVEVMQPKSGLLLLEESAITHSSCTTFPFPVIIPKDLTVHNKVFLVHLHASKTVQQLQRQGSGDQRAQPLFKVSSDSFTKLWQLRIRRISPPAL